MPGDAVKIKFKKPPRSALLFDLDTGRVLWRRDPTRVLPIASLTKMMTALVVVDRVQPGAKVHDHQGGAALPGLGRRAAAQGQVDRRQHDALRPDAAVGQRRGDRARAARRGRQRAALRALHEREGGADGPGLHPLLHPERLRGQGQPLLRRRPRGDRRARSCASRAWPRSSRRARRSSRSRSRAGSSTSTTTTRCCSRATAARPGIKTGYTDAAGRCLVATVRRGAIKLGVVLLDSPDPGKQAMQLLDRGFKASATD